MVHTAAANSLQSCPTLWVPIDGSPTGSPVPGILQVRTLEWVGQAPISMGFPRQEYWSGLPFPSAGDLPDSGVEIRSPALQADSLLTEPSGKPAQAFATF